MKGAFSRSSSPWIAGLFVALVLLLFFHRVDELPLPHGDEQSFLDVPYRFATFGDLRYPVFMSESFGAADLRPYPPIAALTLRSVAVKAVGFSARNSRYVSGVLIFTVLVGAFVWLRRRFDLPWPSAALLLAPAAFAPVVLIAARNTRLEQEAFFFGSLSALDPAAGPAVRRHGSRRRGDPQRSNDARRARPGHPRLAPRRARRAGAPPRHPQRDA